MTEDFKLTLKAWQDLSVHKLMHCHHWKLLRNAGKSLQ